MAIKVGDKFHVAGSTILVEAIRHAPDGGIWVDVEQTWPLHVSTDIVAVTLTILRRRQLISFEKSE